MFRFLDDDNKFMWALSYVIAIPTSALIAVVIAFGMENFLKVFIISFVTLMIIVPPILKAASNTTSYSKHTKHNSSGKQSSIKTRIRGYKPTEWKSGGKKSLFY